MSLEDFRTVAQAVAARAKNDPAYQQQLLDDPMGMLTAAGVSREIAQQLLDADAEPDVQGYSLQIETGCNDTTCWTSGCPGSCNVTVCGTTYAPM
jgi:hypothetical protein